MSRLQLNPSRRLVYLYIALIVAVASILPAFHGKAYAYGQISNRGIEMSSSQAGKTGVQYTVSFKTATAGAIEGIVVDFCDNDPIIGDSCTFTSGQSIDISSVTLNSIVGPSDTTVGHWTLGTTSPLLTLTDASSTTSEPTNTQVTIVLSGFINPHYTSTGLCATAIQPNCTFYARMLTYTTTGGATGYTATNPSAGAAPTDAGGAALSTAAQINITSKVQEELGFCVFSSASSGTCGTTPNVLLGNNNDVLVTGGPFVDVDTTYTIQTNASIGAAINIQGSTLQANGGAFSIPGIASAPAASNPGTSQFGLCTYESSGTSLTPVTNYNGGVGHLCSTTTQSAGTSTPGGDAGAFFYFPAAVQGTYGDTIANDTAGSTATGIIAFIGNIAITQQAGIYTTSLSLIANGTF